MCFRVKTQNACACVVANQKNMVIVLWHTKECLDYFLMLTRVSKTNGKNMFDCFVNIYADIELADCYSYMTVF